MLGISAQGYYKHDYASNEADILSASIVLYCLYVRQKECLPKAGCRELYTLCREYFREKFTIGRDRFYNVLRSNSLMLRRTRYRPRTTDSRHGYRLYRDLVNTSPKYTPAGNGRLVVADITYIYTREGFAYLSLVTDAYSRYIVGYCLSRTLDAEGPLKAMYMALETYRAYGISTEGMIHHSDRGVQYASKQYTLHNALAERMNNTLKNGWLFNEGDMDFRQAEEAVSKSVAMYNNARPHRALG
ncbi:integrase core domain-containing protein, partial [Phocaeicola plebeius]|uniref:integrase core domain-containing protein n=1 Tax=Phocaeicola plebeius TaxID=310297 RepID=UPI0022E3C613